MQSLLDAYLATLARVTQDTTVTDGAGAPVAAGAAMAQAVQLLETLRENDNKILFIGNGGSAGISSHMAIDFLRNGRIPALAFNDGAMLTCFGNDFGYETVFAHQVAAHGRQNDLLVAISSSGRSANILRGVEAARQRGCRVITLSGFAPDNPLRQRGDLNFYTASSQYGFVEISHQTLIHALLDLAMGWRE